MAKNLSSLLKPLGKSIRKSAPALILNNKKKAAKPANPPQQGAKAKSANKKNPPSKLAKLFSLANLYKVLALGIFAIIAQVAYNYLSPSVATFDISIESSDDILVGEEVEVTIKARDRLNHTVKSFDSFAALSLRAGEEPGEVLVSHTGTAETSRFSDGTWRGSIQFHKSGDEVVLIAESEGIRGESEPIKVHHADLESVILVGNTSPKISSTEEYRAQAVDRYSNPIFGLEYEFSVPEVLGDVVELNNDKLVLSFPKERVLADVIMTAKSPDGREATGAQTISSIADDATQLVVKLADYNNKISGVPFEILVSATDAHNNKVTDFLTVNLDVTDTTGTVIKQTETLDFQNGTASVFVSIGKPQAEVILDVTDGTLSGKSEAFSVLDGGTASTLTLFDGNNQNGEVGEPFDQPLVIRVLNPDGTPKSDVAVKFEVSNRPEAARGGVFQSENIVKTNDNGEASIKFVSGSAVGTYVVAAKNDTLIGSPINFALSAGPSKITSMRVIPANLTVVAGARETLVARGFDKFQNEVVVNPKWSVVRGGGSVIGSEFIAGEATGTFKDTLVAELSNLTASGSAIIVNTLAEAVTEDGNSLAAVIGQEEGGEDADGNNTDYNAAIKILGTGSGQIESLRIFPGDLSTSANNPLFLNAVGYDVTGNPITDAGFNWFGNSEFGVLAPLANGGAMFIPNGKPGTFEVEVEVESNAAIKILQAAPIVITGYEPDDFEFVIDSQFVRLHEPMNVTIRAVDYTGNLDEGFTGSALLGNATGGIFPVQTDAFAGGEWTGDITISSSSEKTYLTASKGDVMGTSDVLAITGASGLYGSAGSLRAYATMSLVGIIGLASTLGPLLMALRVSKEAIAAIRRNPLAKKEVYMHVIFTYLITIGIGALGLWFAWGIWR